LVAGQKRNINFDVVQLLYNSNNIKQIPYYNEDNTNAKYETPMLYFAKHKQA